eukprot:gene17517-biopygen5983
MLRKFSLRIVFLIGRSFRSEAPQPSFEARDRTTPPRHRSTDLVRRRLLTPPAAPPPLAHMLPWAPRCCPAGICRDATVALLMHDVAPKTPSRGCESVRSCPCKAWQCDGSTGHGGCGDHDASPGLGAPIPRRI